MKKYFVRHHRGKLDRRKRSSRTLEGPERKVRSKGILVQNCLFPFTERMETENPLQEQNNQYTRHLM
jgi:hypothetical protein